MADNGPTDLELIQAKMNVTTDQSLESTQRMVKMCAESQDAGMKTLGMLNEQGEQLNRVEEGLDTINADMKKTEENLNDLNKCCGLCVLPWNRTKTYSAPKREGSSGAGGKWSAADGDRASVRISSKSNRNGDHVVQSQPDGPYVTRITNDAREDEMEDNLRDVHGMIGNMKNMAVDMNAEITTQNKQIDRIITKTEHTDGRIVHANKQANKLLK